MAGTPPSPIPTGSEQSAAGGEGQERGAPQVRGALAAIVSELVSLQRKRQFCIVSQSRGDRSIESLIASTMGFRIDADEKDRKALFARAKAFRLAVERDGESHRLADTQFGGALSAVVPLILAAQANRQPWDDLRKRAEKDMVRLARQLPCYAYANTVRGLKDGLALAVLQAEAGIPFGEYRTISGLWKRMGLAVINGERQQRMKGAVALEQAYSPRRRAEVFAFISDSMFRHQWRAADEAAGTEAHPIGHYGEVYARRRAHTEPRIEATADLPDKIMRGGREVLNPAKWTRARCHNDARRVMSKVLLRDLWRVSRGLSARAAPKAEE